MTIMASGFAPRGIFVPGEEAAPLQMGVRFVRTLR